jgi:glycosyltransferase involved in cell wall biosynthesis
MTPDVTIIIPCYKVGKYLRQCLDSVLNQSHSNIQVLAINDASPDDSGMILDEYVARDPRLQVIHQPVNAGVSVARNTGLSKTIAPYTMFLDGDDWLLPDAVANLLAIQRQSNAEFVCTNIRQYSDEGQPGRIHYSTPQGQYQPDFQQGIDHMRLHQKLFCTCTAKLFPTALLHQHKLIFHAELRHAQDTLFTHSFIIFARPRTVINYDLATYCYRQNPASTVHAIPLEKRLHSLHLLIETLDNLAIHCNQPRWLAAEKSAEYFWAIRKFSANSDERQNELARLMSSAFFQNHLQPVLSQYGKLKHRILLKLFERNFYRTIALW